MIEPALELARDADAVYFVADYHALTTVRDPTALRDFSFEITATWLALGLDPDHAILYLQSDIPEVCELSWLVGCVLAKGLLNRGHIYKSVVDQNRAAGRPTDEGVSAGVFNYPLLTAADILLHGAVGVDHIRARERDVVGSCTVAHRQVDAEVVDLVLVDGVRDRHHQPVGGGHRVAGVRRARGRPASGGRRANRRGRVAQGSPRRGWRRGR
jgi:tRNA synthetases class I (W and Y)